MVGAMVRLLSALSILIFVMSLQPAAAAEEATINIFSVVDSQGRTVQTGTKEATFVGVLKGILFAETEKGPVEIGTIVCPATVKIGIEDATQKGEGSCAITAKDGAQAFADVSCTGVYLVGCDGTMTLTGGTGRYAGISGGGSVNFRSSLRLVVATSAGDAMEHGTAILVARGLHYRIP